MGDEPVVESQVVEDQLVDPEVVGVQSEFLVVAAPNVAMVVDQSGCPVEEQQHAFPVVVVDRRAFRQDPHATLEVDRNELFEVAAQCSVVDPSVSFAGVEELNAEGVH